MVPQWLEMVAYIKASKEHHAMGPLMSTFQAGQHINLFNIKVSFVIHILKKCACVQTVSVHA